MTALFVVVATVPMPEGSISQVSAAAMTNETTIPADGVLLDAVRHGDDEAFTVLFDRYYASVHAVSLRVIGSVEDAEEVALDVFLKLHQRPVDHLKNGELGGWLYRTALNASFNAVRARKRRFGWLRRAAVLQSGDTGSSENPAESVVRNSEAEIVRRNLGRLPEQQRNALVLRSHGFQYSEIASALDIKPSSVGTILARAERSLRKQLENEVEL